MSAGGFFRGVRRVVTHPAAVGLAAGYGAWGTGTSLTKMSDALFDRQLAQRQLDLENQFEEHQRNQAAVRLGVACESIEKLRDGESMDLPADQFRIAQALADEDFHRQQAAGARKRADAHSGKKAESEKRLGSEIRSAVIGSGAAKLIHRLGGNEVAQQAASKLSEKL